jgi:hypothetical protein
VAPYPTMFKVVASTVDHSFAHMVKLVDAADSKSVVERRGGSIPSVGT